MRERAAIKWENENLGRFAVSKFGSSTPIQNASDPGAGSHEMAIPADSKTSTGGGRLHRGGDPVLSMGSKTIRPCRSSGHRFDRSGRTVAPEWLERKAAVPRLVEVTS
jgi:hypothetical protein